MHLSLPKQSQKAAQASRESLVGQLYILLVGTFFGIVLVKSEVASWFRIQKMFLFEEAHMYLIIASAIVVGAIGIYIIKKFQLKTVEGQAINVKSKPFNKGVVIGGITFGTGWVITGACPGPIYAQIGSGEFSAIITLLAALAGMYLYAYLQPKLPH